MNIVNTYGIVNVKVDVDDTDQCSGHIISSGIIAFKTIEDIEVHTMLTFLTIIKNHSSFIYKK